MVCLLEKQGVFLVGNARLRHSNLLARLTESNSSNGNLADLGNSGTNLRVGTE